MKARISRCDRHLATNQSMDVRVEMRSNSQITVVILWNLRRVKVKKGLEKWSDYFLQQTEILIVQRMKQTS